MGRIGITEILVLIIPFILIPFLIIRSVYRYGKTTGRNEVLEELREEEREKLKRQENGR